MSGLLSSLSLYRVGDTSAGRVARLLFFASIVVFAAHNAEEFWGIDAWARTSEGESARLYYRFDRFLIAIGLLTFVYAGTVAWAARRWRPMPTLLMLLGFSAVVANGLVHVGARALLDSAFPGWITAACVVLPFGGSYVRAPPP